jgi:hypothetical protein
VRNRTADIIFMGIVKVPSQNADNMSKGKIVIEGGEQNDLQRCEHE